MSPRAPLACEERTDDAVAGSSASLGAPTVELRLSAIIDRVEGDPAVRPGDTCAFTLAYREGRRFSCRAAVTCGSESLYGTRPTNGFFACELDPREAPVIRGEDPETSQRSGDPALRVDTGAGTLFLEEDAESPGGPYRIEARLTPAE